MTRKDVDNVIFVDACEISAKPGEIAFVMAADDVSESITTHKVPLSLLMGLIQKEGKNTHLVGIQPESLDFGKGISKVVGTSLSVIEGVVKKKLG